MSEVVERKLTRLWASTPDRHSLLEDIQGVLAGSMLVSLGVTAKPPRAGAPMPLARLA